MSEANEMTDGAALIIGRRWMKNSSLENWFPITAEELNRLHAEVEQLKTTNHQLEHGKYGRTQLIRENMDLGRAKALWDYQSVWSQIVFGADAERGPIGPLKHLICEAQEAIAAPKDPTEYADCLLLIFDAARRAGLTYEGLIEAAMQKHMSNKSRIYPKPAVDEPSFHQKEQP